MRDVAYLQLLAREFPSVKEATGEIVNLMAICSLPKGTEYFFSDLHGEYEAFIHLLRSSSGIIRRRSRKLLICDPGGGAAAAGKPDLLSGAPSVQDDEAGQIYGGLAAYHHLPAGTDLPGGGIQVYPFQGPQKDAEGICIYH